MLTKLKAWLGQVTTGHGMMVLAPTILAVLSGQLTWLAAAPLLTAAAIGLLWPENTALASQVKTLVTDVENVYEAQTAQATTAVPKVLGMLVLGILAGTLVACESAASSVAQTEVALTAAERAAFQYASLPRCPATGLCSDAGLVAQIKSYDQTAYAAVKAARASNSSADQAAAAAALAVLVAFIPAAQ